MVNVIVRNWEHNNVTQLCNYNKIEKECSEIGINSSTFTTLLDYKEHRFDGHIFSLEHRRKFELNNTPIQIVRDTDNRLKLHINHKPIKEWFMEQWEKLRQAIHRPMQTPKHYPYIGYGNYC